MTMKKGLNHNRPYNNKIKRMLNARQKMWDGKKTLKEQAK